MTAFKHIIQSLAWFSRIYFFRFAWILWLHTRLHGHRYQISVNMKKTEFCSVFEYLNLTGLTPKDKFTRIWMKHLGIMLLHLKLPKSGRLNWKIRKKRWNWAPMWASTQEKIDSVHQKVMDDRLSIRGTTMAICIFHERAEHKNSRWRRFLLNGYHVF